MAKNIERRPTLVWVLLIVVLANVGFTSYLFLEKSSIQKFAFVDAMRLISSYKGTASAQQEIALRNKGYLANLDSLKAELNSLTTEYASGQSTNKATLGKNLAEKQNQLAQYEQMVRENMQKSDQEVTNKIISTVNDYLKRYGEKEGYTIIFAAMQYGNIAYGEKAVDITDIVLAGLNDEYNRKK